LVACRAALSLCHRRDAAGDLPTPYVHGPSRLALPHHKTPAWLTDLHTYDEADSHLSRLIRITGSSCIRYHAFLSRPHTRVQLPGGVAKEIAVAR
jgi:hypothetical protein